MDRRGFFGRLTGGLASLWGGNRSEPVTKLAVPDEWTKLAGKLAESPHLHPFYVMSIEEFASLPYRGTRVFCPQEAVMSSILPPDPKDAAQAILKFCGVQPGQIYRHYKGGLYTVTKLSIKEDTLEQLVTYCSNLKGMEWTRTLKNWNELVVVDSGESGEFDPRVVRQVPRFSRVLE